MHRPATSSMAVSTLAFAAIGLVVVPRALSSDPCADIHNDHKRHQCRASLMPKSYPVHQMGEEVYGGGHKHSSDPKRSVAKLRGPSGTPDVTYHLTAAIKTVNVAGRRMRVFTVNGKTPGPTLHATEGDLVKVVLTNRNIDAGTSLHWHGVDVPIAEDGVAGVTQNAVKKGDDFVYRFRAVDAGTYWYHSHQYSLKQVTRGLIGALVIDPAAPNPSDVVAVAHSYGGRSTINGITGAQQIAGNVTGRRLRFVNTNQTRMFVASSVPYQVLAVDGFDLNGPTTVSASRYVEVPAAGRVDIRLNGGPANARVGLLGGPSLIFGGGSPPRLDADRPLNLLKYGTPDPALNVPSPDRKFDYVVGQRTGYLDGRAGNWFTINGKLIPHVPMFMANKSDDVRVRLVNHTAIDHPMHLHGQHMLVLSRNGVPSTGSPWWVDTLEVHPGEQFVVQFRAANRGDWMFHCHILEHAAKGLMTHLSYMNLNNPYRIGTVSRQLTNHPE